MCSLDRRTSHPCNAPVFVETGNECCFWFDFDFPPYVACANNRIMESVHNEILQIIRDVLSCVQAVQPSSKWPKDLSTFWRLDCWVTIEVSISVRIDVVHGRHYFILNAFIHKEKVESFGVDFHNSDISCFDSIFIISLSTVHRPPVF